MQASDRSFRRGALLLVVFASLPFGWDEGRSGCAGDPLRVYTGRDLVAHDWLVFLLLRRGCEKGEEDACEEIRAMKRR
jgi:hypothetical protein